MASQPHHPSRRLAALAAVSLLVLLTAAEVATAQPVTPGSAAANAGTRSRWAGSAISYTNSTTAIGLQRDIEPTWQPQYNMALTLAPRFRIADGLALAMLATANRELTDNDWTTYAGETWLTDSFVTLNLAAPRLDAIATALGMHVRFRLPTSKASMARTLRLGSFAGVSTTTSTGFNLLGLKQSVALQLVGRIGYLWHRYTEASLETPWLAGCGDLAGGCAPFAHNGRRNSQWQTQLMAAFNWQLHPTVGLAVQAGVFLDRPYQLSDGTTTSGDIDVPVDPTDPNLRGTSFYVVQATWQPISVLAVSLGSQTFDSQLRPDSTYRRPFFNRSTTLFLGLSFFPSALFAGAAQGGS